MSQVIPSLSLLNQSQTHLVHKHSLEILQNTGIKVESQQAIELFEKATGTTSSNNIIKIPAEIVEHAINKVPSSINIYNRQSSKRFTLGNGSSKSHFGIGVTNLYYQNPEDDKITDFTRKNMGTSVALGNRLDQFDIISTVGVLKDLPTKTADLYGVLEMVANTTKPIIILISETSVYQQAISMLEELFGDIGNNPFVIPYFNPVTPLVINKETSEKMFLTIDKGLPYIYSNYGMYGATTPITQGGSLALLNAELLAGLTLSQIYKEGSPIILGSLPAGFDMQTMGSIYTPQTMQINLACAEMMDFYKIPHAGTSGSGIGRSTDILGAGMQWMNHLTSTLGKAGLAPFVGGNFDSMVFSPTLAVYANHIINASRNFSQGFSIDSEEINTKDIDLIGPGGNFLTSEQTLMNMGNSMTDDGIWNNFSLEKWQEEGCPKAIDDLKNHTINLINNPIIPEDRQEILEKGEKIIQSYV